MTWLVDIGNSSIKWAEYTAGKLAESQTFLRTQLGIAEDLDSIWGNLQSPQQLICCSVAGEAFEQELMQWCQQVWELQPVFIRALEQGFGVTNAYTNTERLGADRWVAMVAAHQLVPGASCVIDCGTATTIDVLQADGQHLGGLIIPGLRLMAEALTTRTQIVIDESEGDNTTLFARNTADAIHGGALYALVATLDRVYNDVEQALEMPVKRIITGGDATEILPLLSGEHQFMPDLVLQGLMIIAESMHTGDA